jgi:hypothetical protein
VKDWSLIPVVSTPKGKQKGVVLSSGRSFAEVLRSAAGINGKFVGLRSLSVIPLDLLPNVSCNELANGGEEVRLVVNCFEFESWSSGSSTVASSATVKKTKGSFVNHWLKKLLGLCRFGLDRVRSCLGHSVGLGFKAGSKKPILQLKPVCKSLGRSSSSFSGLPCSPKVLGVVFQVGKEPAKPLI